jgi:hypothetical protein
LLVFVNFWVFPSLKHQYWDSTTLKEPIEAPSTPDLPFETPLICMIRLQWPSLLACKSVVAKGEAAGM